MVRLGPHEKDCLKSANFTALGDRLYDHSFMINQLCDFGRKPLCFFISAHMWEGVNVTVGVKNPVAQVFDVNFLPFFLSEVGLDEAFFVLQ